MCDDFEFPTLDTLFSIGALQYSNTSSFSTEDWINLVISESWKLLEFDIENNVGTPDVLWWSFLKKNVMLALECKKADRFEHGYEDLVDFSGESNELIHEISYRCWIFFYKQLLGDKIDRAFHTIYFLGGGRLTPSTFKRLGGIQSTLRRKMGLKFPRFGGHLEKHV
jgi:hypothetical protein